MLDHAISMTFTAGHGRRKRLLGMICLCVAGSLVVGRDLQAQLRYVSTPFRHGELLTYKVKWGFIRLGTVRVRQSIAAPLTADTMLVELDGVSAAGLPFIDVHFLTTALLDVRRPTNIRYELRSGPEQLVQTLYATDPSTNTATAISTDHGLTTRLDTLSADPPFYDGSGLLMLVRCAAGSDTTLVLPTVMDHALGTTKIVFSSAIEEISVPAFARPIRSHPYTGTTDWIGSSFAGMSGDFRGWVSTDDTRRILRAEVKLFLGWATIELEELGTP